MKHHALRRHGLGLAAAVSVGLFLTLIILNYRHAATRADRSLAGRDTGKAVAYWKIRMQTSKTSQSYEKLTLCCIADKNYGEARKWAVAGLTKFPGCANLSFNLALLDYYDTRYGESLRRLDDVLRTNGYYPNAHYLKGLVYEAQGDAASAKKEYVAEVNINPGSVRAWEKLKGIR